MVDVGIVVEAASALLLVGLGVAVLFVRPLRPPAVAFALFSILWGLVVVLVNSTELFPNISEPLFYASAVADLGTIGALVWLTLVFPQRPEAKDRRAFWTAGLVAGAGVATVLWLTYAGLGHFAELEPDLYSTGFLTFVLVYPFFMGSLLYAILLWTLRFLTVPVADRIQRGQYALAVAALVSWVGFFAGTGPDPSVSPRVAIQTREPVIVALAGLPLAVLFLVAATWLYAQSKSPGDRVPRNMAWFVLGMPLLGLLYSYMEPWGAFALTRVLATALLAIGILRFQMLSLDVKIRWTVSRSTVAVVIVAVFVGVQTFVSEYFTDAVGLLGGAAAAAVLVFAIAPLQRAADRVAAKAVPGGESGLFKTKQIEEAYRKAVRMVVRDGVVSPDEEVELAGLADSLGLSAARAMEIRQEVSKRRPQGAGGDREDR